MDLSNIIGIIGTILEIIGIIIAIIELLKSKSDAPNSTSVTYVKYKESIVTTKVNNTNQKGSNSSGEAELAFMAIAGIVVLTISLAFHSIISTILSFATSFYLFRCIYIVKKDKIPTPLSTFLILRAITITGISLSTFYIHPQLLNIAKDFPDILQSLNGASHLLDWFITSGKILVKNVLNFNNTGTTFPYIYILLRTGSIAYLVSYLFTSVSRKSILYQIYKYDVKPRKVIVISTLSFIFLVILLHINLIYFSILEPMLNSINHWLSN